MKIELSGTNTAWWSLSHPVTNDHMTSKLPTRKEEKEKLYLKMPYAKLEQELRNLIKIFISRTAQNCKRGFQVA